jgi:uncharacterized protein (DUF1697 family)
MPRYVALLRSVNVAGHGRLAMDELRHSFATLGYSDISTYIQTGNVLFGAPSKSQKKLVADIETQLEHDFGTSPAVLVRSIDELATVATTSPYPTKGADPARHHVTFLAERPSRQRLAAFDPPASGRDELTIIEREVYVHTPDGYHATKLTGTYLERHLGVMSTTRNWNTVTKLLALAQG